MKRMAKSRGDYLGKGRTQCAPRIGGRVRLNPQIAVEGTGDMAEFVNQSALLCRDQQQQETQRFEGVSHASWHRPKIYQR
jgi:hypothetical protein